MVLAVSAIQSSLSILPASAEHEVYTSKTHSAAPYGRHNGYRVYLSAPTHPNSGSKGECRPGWDENINGRFWNFYSTISSYYAEKKAPDSQWRNLKARGYWTLVSGNIDYYDSRYKSSVGYKNHRSEANEWGAHVYLTTHTNAAVAARKLPTICLSCIGMATRKAAPSQMWSLRNLIPPHLVAGVELVTTDRTDQRDYTNSTRML
ncbi:MAG: hypothetical protein ACREA0_01700 [bacterium]